MYGRLRLLSVFVYIVAQDGRAVPKNVGMQTRRVSITRAVLHAIGPPALAPPGMSGAAMMHPANRTARYPPKAPCLPPRAACYAQRENHRGRTYVCYQSLVWIGRFLLRRERLRESQERGLDGDKPRTPVEISVAPRDRSKSSRRPKPSCPHNTYSGPDPSFSKSSKLTERTDLSSNGDASASSQMLWRSGQVAKRLIWTVTTLQRLPQIGPCQVIRAKSLFKQLPE